MIHILGVEDFSGVLQFAAVRFDGLWRFAREESSNTFVRPLTEFPTSKQQLVELGYPQTVRSLNAFDCEKILFIRVRHYLLDMRCRL